MPQCGNCLTPKIAPLYWESQPDDVRDDEIKALFCSPGLIHADNLSLTPPTVKQTLSVHKRWRLAIVGCHTRTSALRGQASRYGTIAGLWRHGNDRTQTCGVRLQLLVGHCACQT